MENQLTCIIVDDEESARDVLSNLITRFCPQLKIIATCCDVVEAVKTIKKLEPQVVFLDIEMPNYAGYELVNFFDEVNFEIIFITAYDQYAIKAFEVSAVDYLLKPVEIDRLKESCSKLLTKNQLQLSFKNYKALSQNLKTDHVSKIVVRHNGGQEIICVDEIVAIEAKEAYSCIHTTKGKYLASKNLKHFENVLSENVSFFRTHKSWIINTKHLLSFSKSKLEIELTNKLVAKLSKYRKPEFEEIIIQ